MASLSLNGGRDEVVLAQGFVLHRRALHDTWERSWATLTMPQSGLPVLTLRNQEGGRATASLPLHPDCSLSLVAREMAPPLLGTPSNVLFGAPASLLPQERYCAFSVVWPKNSVYADEPRTDPRVSVFTRTCSRNEIARALGNNERSPNGTPSVYTVAATVVLGLSTLAAALQWSYGDWRQSDSIAESWRIVDQFSTILGGSMTAPAALGIVVSVVAVLVGCAWIIARRIRSARVAKTRLASCRAWTSEAWNQVGSRHHISALAGGQLSTLVLGADTVERAEKWRRVFEKAIGLARCGAWPSNGFSSQLPSPTTTSVAASTPSPALPPCPAAMLNSSDLWLRSSGLPWQPKRDLVRGKQVWEMDKACKVSEVVEGDSAAVMRCLVGLHTSSGGGSGSGSGSGCKLVEQLTDFSDVIRWRSSGDGHEYCLLRQWRTDPDCSSILTLDSVDHPNVDSSSSTTRRGAPAPASSLHLACLVVPDSSHRGHGGCPPPEGVVAAPGPEAFASTNTRPRRRGSMGRYRRRSNARGTGGDSSSSSQVVTAGDPSSHGMQRPLPPLVPASPPSFRDALPHDAAAAEAHAASVAAAAAAAAVLAALPPSCLVIVAGTIQGSTHMQGHDLVVNLLSDLTDSLDSLRFAPVPLPKRPEEEDGGDEADAGEDEGAGEEGTEEVRPTRKFRTSRFGRRKPKESPAAAAASAAAASAENATYSSSSAANTPSEVTLSPAAARALELERLATLPPCTCPTSQWCSADMPSFAVRGPTFDEDRVKIPATEAMFDLVATDLWRVEEALPNIAAQPSNRVQQAWQRGDKRWLFVLQIQVPGPPHFAFVCYYAPRDPDSLKSNTPFGRLAAPFFFGDSDEFRDSRFKLIPRVVEGNFIVRNAVGAKPTILGKKLKQHYHRGPNYFELDIDVSSSLIAQRVVGIAYGYAKLLTVDLAMVLQGDARDELPEVPFAGMRLVGLDFDAAPDHPPVSPTSGLGASS